MLKTTSELIQEAASQIEQEIIDLRRHFHKHPELSGKEFETSKFICSYLDNLGIEYVRVEGKRPNSQSEEREDYIGTGIIATISGCAPGSYNFDGSPCKRIALRADIDALPVTEETEFDFASQNEGVMHACGHDCHAAMLLGTAKILTQIADRIKGEVRLIFQPAEEISTGARDMIAAGALDGVDAIYGTHIWSDIDAGKVSCEAGQRMASTDWFRVDIKGVSAHGSMPHRGIDAIVIGAEIISNLQLLVSRDFSPFEPTVVTVGEFHGGEARNVMAGSAYFTGTVRTWSEATRDNLENHFNRIVGKLSHAFYADMNVEYEHGNPCLVNDAKCSEIAQNAARKVLGNEALETYKGTMAGEDFSEYLQRIPGVFVFLGTRNPEIGAEHPQHSCYFTIDESVLVKGSMMAAQWACDMLE